MLLLDEKAVWPGWTTVRLIGRGSFGAVYEIERDIFGEKEKAALKHISIPQSDGEVREMRSEGLDELSITQSFADQARDIVAEYKLMARLNDCPYAVSCHDVEFVQKDDGYGWDILIRMELLTPFMELLSEKRAWPESGIVKLGRDICSALVACRKLNIIHRDIKPQNIFVSKNGDYKLGDFGIARIAEKTSSATARIGTYSYMAPEVYNGEHYGSGADIYSLGMVLYWLLNERRAPFVSVNTAREKESAQRRRMSGEPIPAPAHGSEALKRIVLKACAYDPKDRYQSAEEMLRDLEALNGPAATTVPVLEPVGAAVSRAPASQDTDDDGTVGMFGKPALAPAKATAPGSPSVPDEEGTIGVFKTTAPANTERPPVPDEDGTLGVFKKSDSVPAAVADSHTLAEQKPKKEESKAERSGPDKKSEPEKTSKPGHSSEPVPPAPPKKKTGLIVGVLGALAAAVILLLVLLPKGGQSASTLPASQPTTEAQQTAQATAKPAAKPTAEPTANPTAIPGNEERIAMITDYGDITDQSFNQTTYEACKAWSEANGAEFTYFKPASDDDQHRVAMIEKAIDQDYNVIVMPGYAFAAAIASTVNKYPDTTFIALDIAESDLTSAGLKTIPANLYSAVYQEELCGYMAGYAAVKLGYTKLGFLGGMAVPAVVRYGYGFVQGANDAAKADGKTDVTMNYAYGNQFYGDADITAAMDTWYANGTQIVFTCGGGIYTSAGEAAAKVGGKVIGVDVDQSFIIDAIYGEGMTVTSAMKGLGFTVKTQLDAVQNGTFRGGVVECLGLVSADPDQNYVGLAPSTQFGAGFTKSDYAVLISNMFSGKYAVSNDVAQRPTAFATAITVRDLGNLK